MSKNVPEQNHSVANPGAGPIGKPASEAVQVKRGLNRATYEDTQVNEILDAGWLCHMGTIRDAKPVVIPMFYVRDGDSILVHGAPASGFVRRGRGNEVCVTVTHLDGLVLARSAFHHSVNYRSVVIIGEAVLIDDSDEKERALELFIDQLVPGRQAQVRPTTLKESRATHVLRISLDQASAKVRTGGPIDDEPDYDYDVWAGVVPLDQTLGRPVADSRLKEGVDLPDNLKTFTGFQAAQ